MPVKNKGFTLIELLVVMVIISILAAIAVPNINKWIEQGKGARAMTDMDILAKEVDHFYLQVSRFPKTLTELYDQHYLSSKMPRTPWDTDYQFVYSTGTTAEGETAMKFFDHPTATKGFRIYVEKYSENDIPIEDTGTDEGTGDGTGDGTADGTGDGTGDDEDAASVKKPMYYVERAYFD